MAVTTPSSVMEATAARLLDFSSEYDVALLDSTVDLFFGSRSNEEVRELRTTFNGVSQDLIGAFNMITYSLIYTFSPAIKAFLGIL